MVPLLNLSYVENLYLNYSHSVMFSEIFRVDDKRDNLTKIVHVNVAESIESVVKREK